jgi:catechol 2,3-dioxygenase-like lactoylglutathione lyase family enzyme
VIIGIDHVQLAMPAGHEAKTRAFYTGLLGMDELAKPAPLAARGGCWFTASGIQLHLGVEADFRPARKAHPALLVEDFAAFCARLAAAGVDVTEDTELPEVHRANIHDPFGNRIELVDAMSFRD